MDAFQCYANNAPNYAQFTALDVPELVAYYTHTQVLDGIEDERRLRDDRLLMNTGSGNIEKFAAAVSRDYYQFKVDRCQTDRSTMLCWFRRPANITERKHDYLFPWDIGSELRLFDAYSREFVCKGRVDGMWRQTIGSERSATGAIVLVNVVPTTGGLGRQVYEMARSRQQ